MDNSFLLFIGIAFLFVGGLDLLHTFAYKGMSVFSFTGANVATQLWVAARYVAGVSFLAASLLVSKKPSKRDLCSLFSGNCVVAGFYFLLEYFSNGLCGRCWAYSFQGSE